MSLCIGTRVWRASRHARRNSSTVTKTLFLTALPHLGQRAPFGQLQDERCPEPIGDVPGWHVQARQLLHTGQAAFTRRPGHFYTSVRCPRAGTCAGAREDGGRAHFFFGGPHRSVRGRANRRVHRRVCGRVCRRVHGRVCRHALGMRDAPLEGSRRGGRPDILVMVT